LVYLQTFVLGHNAGWDKPAKSENLNSTFTNVAHKKLEHVIRISMSWSKMKIFDLFLTIFKRAISLLQYIFYTSIFYPNNLQFIEYTIFKQMVCNVYFYENLKNKIAYTLKIDTHPPTGPVFPQSSTSMEPLGRPLAICRSWLAVSGISRLIIALGNLVKINKNLITEASVKFMYFSLTFLS